MTLVVHVRPVPMHSFQRCQLPSRRAYSASRSRVIPVLQTSLGPPITGIASFRHDASFLVAPCRSHETSCGLKQDGFMTSSASFQLPSAGTGTGVGVGAGEAARPPARLSVHPGAHPNVCPFHHSLQPHQHRHYHLRVREGGLQGLPGGG